jgi:hypothetical protein
MNTHQQIIALWPTRLVLALEMGVSEGVVNAWNRRNNIPPSYWNAIIQAAKKRGYRQVTGDLLLKTMKPRKRRGSDSTSECGVAEVA